MSSEHKRRRHTVNSKTRAKAQNAEETEVTGKHISSVMDITIKRNNFIKACELVSQRAYHNYAERFQLIYMPVCIDRASCVHISTTHLVIKQIPEKVVKLVELEMEASNWCGALEVCIMSITHDQYLSDVVLKHIVNIMLNAHENLSSGYTISQVIDKCKLVLSLQFSTHSPCLYENIRSMYTTFLTSPMDSKSISDTDRVKFGCEKGIVNYCLTRLEDEVKSENEDNALFVNTPDDMTDTIKGMFYRKQFEVFNMLDRNERINRLMAVLHSIIELLQFDLAITQSIRDSKERRRHKMLMADVLQQTNTCNVTDICTQILKLFSYFIHLEYPEEYIETMTLWLNTLMERFYMGENYPNVDYPSTGSCCKSIVNTFYEIISKLPPKSIVRTLERIKPAYIRHQISQVYCNTLLPSNNNNEETFTVTIDFLNEAKDKDFSKKSTNLLLLKKLNMNRVKPSKVLQMLSNICKNPCVNSAGNNNLTNYPKLLPLSPTPNNSKTEQCILISTLYITLQSYLEAYGVQIIEDKYQQLNENMNVHTETSEDKEVERTQYQVTEGFIKKYTQMFKTLQELIMTIRNMEAKTKPPKVLDIFQNNIFNELFILNKIK